MTDVLGILDSVPTPSHLNLQLGQDAFCVHKDGKISRTIVHKLGGHILTMNRVREPERLAACLSQYELLDSRYGQHFFDFAAALQKAQDVLQARIDADHVTVAQIREAKAYLEQTKQPDFLEKLRAQPITYHAPMSQEEIVVNIADIPAAYFAPGEKVFAIVTWKAHATVSPAWRPAPYFILATDVTSVSWRPLFPETLRYDLGSNFSIDADLICATENAARKKLAEVFTAETGGTIRLDKIRLVSVLEEAEMAGKEWDRIGREVSARMAHAAKYF